MNSLMFLVAFVALSLAGGLLLWYRERGPRSMEAHIREFERELDALSPEAPLPERRRRSSPRPRTRGPSTG